MRITSARGSLVGAIVVTEGDQVLCVKASGQVTRSPVADVAAKGRDTMGVIFAGVREGDAVVAIARNTEDDAVEESEDEQSESADGTAGEQPVDQTEAPENGAGADSQEDST
jgi:DNA gyrase subunit A